MSLNLTWSVSSLDCRGELGSAIMYGLFWRNDEVVYEAVAFLQNADITSISFQSWKFIKYLLNLCAGFSCQSLFSSMVQPSAFLINITIYLIDVLFLNSTIYYAVYIYTVHLLTRGLGL